MIDNPLSDYSIMHYVNTLIKAVVIAALPILILAIVYSGFRFVSARGSSSDLNQAKSIFKKVALLTIAILSIGLIFKLLLNLITTFSEAL